MRDYLREADDERGETPSFVRDSSPNSTEATAGQGRYVVPFTMSREEEAAGMEASRAFLPKLMAECAPPSAESGVDAWTRVKSRKKSAGVLFWEKHSENAKYGSKKKKWGPPGAGSANEAYTASTLDNEPVLYSVRSSATVNAPLDLVLKTLDSSVATAHRSFTRIIYGNLVADTSILYHSSAPSTDILAEGENDSLETLAVRWFVCRCSNPMVSDCDFCLQSYTKRYSIDELSLNSDHYNNNAWEDNDSDDATNETREGLHSKSEVPIAYKLFRSMETRHCPELLESHRVVRCKVPLGGFLLYPTDCTDKTEVVFYMSIAQDAEGDRRIRSRSAPLNSAMTTQCSDRQFRALQNVVRQMALQVGRLNNAVESYKMSLHLESLRTLQWVRNAERTECVVCCRRFNQLTRRRHHCRLCGEVICRECSVHKDVDLPTFGPTVLRICTCCERIHSSSRPKASYIPSQSEPEMSTLLEKPQRRRAPATTDHAIEKLKQGPFADVPLRRRRNTIDDDSTRSAISEKHDRGVVERRFVATFDATQRRNVSEPAASCPKPAASPVIDRRYFANKWCGTRMMPPRKLPVVTTAPNTPKTSLSPTGFHRSSSETFSAPSPHHPNTSHPTSLISTPEDGKVSKTIEAKTNHDSDDEDKYASYAEFSPNGQGSRALPVYAVKNGILADKSAGSGNQQSPSTRGSVYPLNVISRNQQDKPLVYRSFETMDLYEDIFLKLCENSASVRNSKFVALTLFTKANPSENSQQNEIEAGGAAVHYLKVKGSPKLMKVAANLRCCDPILQLQKSVITRNTWALLNGTSPVHPTGYDFRQLPIVFGPQQARFYAGVPLTDSKKRFRYGALAIFDAAIYPGDDDDVPMKKTVQALQVCAREGVMAVNERRKELELRTFLQAPLIQLRQSEPALHLSMEISQSSPRWRDIVHGEQESLDGDSDANDDIDEAQRRLEYELMDARTKSGPEFTDSSSSAGKARVEYFRRKMQELVRQAQDTQAQMVENTLVMERHGVPIV
ncbi:unnamed protein product [Phytophthora fragariaefolia]|uniref:Unnamed protein product n=2 Tax=Phytophthora TaxID=4783 RepID=A0A9W6XE23_9STRA|nr:unnamed protein product [Phytophthora fragariaefolia]